MGIHESESNRRRLSVNKGTREARLSMVVAQLGRSSDPSKHPPTRQPSGGAPVLVGDVNDVHMAKGCRIICAEEPRGSINLEASRGTPENFSGSSQERRIVWKAGCLENLHVRFGVGAGRQFPGLHHLESSPDKAGHWRSSEALAVLRGIVSA